MAWDEVMASYPDALRALPAWQALELLRLDACRARDLPGVHRDMARLRVLRNESLDSTFNPRSIADSLALLPQAYAAANFVVVDQVAKLPQKLSDIYRKLTA